MDIYLGVSPRHARSVYLVFNIETEMVLLHFHVQHDDLFETFHPEDRNPPTIYPWK